MPTSQTRTTVCNLALDLVAELPMSASTDDRPEVRWLNRNFDHTVETALRANLWSFAIEYHELDADGGFEGNSRWRYRYSMPNGALRLIPPTQGGKRGYPPVPYELRGNKIFFGSDPLYADFVMNITNPGEWDPLFVEVIRCSLAVGMAHRFTRKTSFLQLAMQLKQEALEVAEATNAFEAGVEQIEAYDIIRAREMDA